VTAATARAGSSSRLHTYISFVRSATAIPDIAMVYLARAHAIDDETESTKGVGNTGKLRKPIEPPASQPLAQPMPNQCVRVQRGGVN